MFNINNSSTIKEIIQKLEKITFLKKKAVSNYKIAIIPYALLGIILFCMFIMGGLKESSYTLMTLILSILWMVFSSKVAKNTFNYYQKKSGLTYYENELIEYLQDESVQSALINYFNNMVHNNEQLELSNKNLKPAFIDQDYKKVISIIIDMFQIIESYKNTTVSMTPEKDKIKEFEKKLGLLSDSDYKELQFGSQLKKYL